MGARPASCVAGPETRSVVKPHSTGPKTDKGKAFKAQRKVPPGEPSFGEKAAKKSGVTSLAALKRLSSEHMFEGTP